MSTAVLDRVTESGQVTGSAGVVTVIRRTPVCTCRWIGRQRGAVFLAQYDAWMHAAATGCLPGVPLVQAR